MRLVSVSVSVCLWLSPGPGADRHSDTWFPLWGDRHTMMPFSAGIGSGDGVQDRVEVRSGELDRWVQYIPI